MHTERRAFKKTIEIKIIAISSFLFVYFRFWIGFILGEHSFSKLSEYNQVKNQLNKNDNACYFQYMFWIQFSSLLF